MSYRPRTPIEQARIEARGLLRVFMPHEDNSLTKKILTISFVSVWLLITVGLAFQDIGTIAPPHYGIFTAIVFLIVGKQWDIEVERLNPGISLGSKNDDE